MVLGKQRQEDHCKCEASLGYIENFRLAWASGCIKTRQAMMIMKFLSKFLSYLLFKCYRSRGWGAGDGAQQKSTWLPFTKLSVQSLLSPYFF